MANNDLGQRRDQQSLNFQAATQSFFRTRARWQHCEVAALIEKATTGAK
jgi:hypothetical protein